MKQLKRLLLLLVLTSFVVIESKAYDFALDSLYYTIMDNNSVYVSGYNRNLDSFDAGFRNVVIPSSVYHNGVSYSVTGISNSAFKGWIRIFEVILPNTITEIGDKAFQNCTNLQTVQCPANTPPTIYSSTFNNIHSKCYLYVRKHLAETYMNANYWSNFGNRIEEQPDLKVNNIYYYIIDDNSLEVSDNGSNSYSGNVTIPARVTIDGKTYQVTKIGPYAFYYCDNLVKVNMPNTIKSIDRYAFSYCSKLKSITIPESVTRIDDTAIGWYPYLEHINFNAISCDDFSKPDNATSINPDVDRPETIFGDKVQRIPAWIPWGGKNTNLTIPNSVTSIGNGAFYGWVNLKELTIGSNVQLIGDSAFINASIQKINTPHKTPPEIGERTFNRSTLNNSKVFIPARCHLNYMRDQNWREFYFIIQEETAFSGDVNCDSEINVADINSIIDRILSNNNEFDYNSDVNNDGEINIADINSIIQKILDGDNTIEVGSDYYQFNVNGVSFKMIKVDGGTFEMGCKKYTQPRRPTRSVTLSDYYIGETEVTLGLWKALMGNNPSAYAQEGWYSEDLSCPVDNVSWYECREFISKLNVITGKNFRLPTEAEWEYAARGGNLSHGYAWAGCGSLANLNEFAWFNYTNHLPESVATKLPNELGLYDMSGNVFEWCLDFMDGWTSDAVINPTGGLYGLYNSNYKVIRGGSINNDCYHITVNSRLENNYRAHFTCDYPERSPNMNSDHYALIGLRLAF